MLFTRSSSLSTMCEHTIVVLSACTPTCTAVTAALRHCSLPLPLYLGSTITAPLDVPQAGAVRASVTYLVCPTSEAEGAVSVIPVSATDQDARFPATKQSKSAAAAARGGARWGGVRVRVFHVRAVLVVRNQLFREHRIHLPRIGRAGRMSCHERRWRCAWRRRPDVCREQITLDARSPHSIRRRSEREYVNDALHGHLRRLCT